MQTKIKREKLIKSLGFLELTSEKWGEEMNNRQGKRMEEKRRVGGGGVKEQMWANVASPPDLQGFYLAVASEWGKRGLRL